MQNNNRFSFLSQAVSIIFHPVFIPLYVALMYFYLSPRHFLQQNIKFLLIYLSLVSVVIPLLFIGVMFYSKAFSSIDIKTPRERLFLSALMAVVYLIILKKIIRYHQYIELYPFITGTLLTITGLMIYNYFKQMPSIHAAAMSGAVTFFLIWSYYSQINILNYISVFILLTAIVIAARLYLSIHNTPEIIRGILLGILMQIAGFYIGLLVF